MQKSTLNSDVNSDLIAGIDEVGRGCIAGPVFAAAVILPSNHGLSGLRDSKKLSAAQRQRLAPEIERVAVAYALGEASVAEIDEINILQATFLAMDRAVKGLKVRPAQCWVDGNQVPPLGLPVKTIIGGDNTEPSIMAASILAKVARDALMDQLDAQFPNYAFKRHKGYGTAVHMAALRTHGPCSVHRLSFAPCREAQQRLEGV